MAGVGIELTYLRQGKIERLNLFEPNRIVTRHYFPLAGVEPVSFGLPGHHIINVLSYI